MSLTSTDLFAGAGGSSTGMIAVPGVEVTIAANHSKIACDVHNANHPATDHAVVDLHLEDPHFFPRTDILWASPECTKWSQANGSQLPDIEEGLFEDPLSDEVATRSRMLMFDVLRFIDVHRYRRVVVENVVDIAMQAKYRRAWAAWKHGIVKLGYQYRVVSLNSMHAQFAGAPAPQSRDRLYVLMWPNGDRAPDVDAVMRPQAWCPRCDRLIESRQAWKPGRKVGRYRAQYVYLHAECGTTVEPGWLPAAAAIDWSLPGERIGDKTKPLADKTRARIAAGIARYWRPFTLEAAGNTFERRPGVRTWPTDQVLTTLHTSSSKALAVPVEGRDGKVASIVDEPFRTMTCRNETGLAVPFIAELRGGSCDARSVEEPAGTYTASGNHHALVTQFRDRTDRNLDPDVEPLNTIVADGAMHALVTSHRFEYRVHDEQEPLPTFAASGNHVGLVTPAGGSWNDDARPTSEELRTLTTRDAYALVTRHYGIEGGDAARHSKPANEALRTMTANGGNMSLLMPYYSASQTAKPTSDPIGTLTTVDRYALIHRHNSGGAEMLTPAGEPLRTLTTAGHQSVITPGELEAAAAQVDDCMFRMFEPHEVAAGMAFPDTYNWQPNVKQLSKRDLVKLAGNAVTPPAARDLMWAVVESLGGVA